MALGSEVPVLRALVPRGLFLEAPIKGLITAWLSLVTNQNQNILWRPACYAEPPVVCSAGETESQSRRRRAPPELGSGAVVASTLPADLTINMGLKPPESQLPPACDGRRMTDDDRYKKHIT